MNLQDVNVKVSTGLTILGMLAGIFIWSETHFVLAAENEATLKQLLKVVTTNSKAIKSIAAENKLDRVNDRLFKYRLKEEKNGELTDLESERYIGLENTKSKLEAQYEASINEGN